MITLKQLLRPYYALSYYGTARSLPKSTVPLLGTLSSFLRRIYCKGMFAKAGRKLFVEKGSFFGTGADMRVGDEVRFGYNFRVMQRQLTVGNAVVFDQEVLIVGKSYHLENVKGAMVMKGTKEKVPLTIGNGVWIGSRVIIQPECTSIGNGVVIKAGAIVMENIADHAIVEGNRAKVVEG